MMRWFYKVPLRFRSLFRKDQVEQELSEELGFHLEKLTEARVAQGMTLEDARYAALRQLGGIEQTKEECRDMRRVSYIENSVQDIRYGLRVLRKDLSFTIVAVVTLALGIAANTTIFSTISAFLLRKPPLKDPDRLIVVSSRNAARGWDWVGASAPDFESWQKENDVFEEMAVSETSRSFTLTGRGV